MDENRTFPELLRGAQARLVEIVNEGTGTVIVGTGEVVAQLYEAGHTVGLTPKEITQALVKAVREDLRPSLKRS